MSAAVPTPLPGTSCMQMYISCYTVNYITTVIIIIIISIIIILFIYLCFFLILYRYFILHLCGVKWQSA